MELVADLTLVLVAALAGGLVAQRLKQPLIVGVYECLTGARRRLARR